MQRLFLKRLLVIPWVISLLFLSFMVSPNVAFAHVNAAPGFGFSVSPTQGAPGTVITATGSSWTQGETVDISLSPSTTILVSVVASLSEGMFTATFTVPANAAAGQQFVNADGRTGNETAQAPFTVLSSPAPTIDLQTLDIHSLQPLVAGTNPTLRADIRNNGSVASGNFNIRWIADGTIFDGGHYSIPAGAVDTHDHIWSNITPGQHTLTFIANFDHGIPETDYSNNQVTLTFTVASPPQQQNRLFIFVDGVTTSLNYSGVDSSSFGLPNGIYQTLQTQYPTAKFMMFSYKGSDINGNPRGYGCLDTFNQHISHYVSLLRQQITSYMKRNSNTIVGIIGHSMGGVIALGLEDDMVAHGYITTNRGHIDDIATMDSPLGGIPSGVRGLYLDLTARNYKSTKGCEATQRWSDQQFYDLVDLTHVFGNVPRGTNDSLANVVTKDHRTNLAIAQLVVRHGIHTTTFENLDDYLFQPAACPLYGIDIVLKQLHFIDTQLINDQGVNSGIYGRPFVAIVSGGATCTDIQKLAINHGAVFRNHAVSVDLLQFVEGNTPSQLI